MRAKRRIPEHGAYLGALLGFLVRAVVPSNLLAQQAPPNGQALPTHHPPLLAIAQPAPGASIPQDHAVVIFRFSPGEPDDPLDARSFVVLVDRSDRTSLFQVTAAEAWGPLTPNGTDPPSLGAHEVSARICSTRGVCNETSGIVNVAPHNTAPNPASDRPADRKRTLIDLLLAAARKLLTP